ncbi:MAG: phytoene/squalene synthase family protein [Gammaproteobacteria bacterium]|nr:phytoene/squalene synthase family protein [Gammaproteobacteria bacterium]
MSEALRPGAIQVSPPTADDERFQIAILQGVSRTFALTIPVLPPALCRAVGNAYLLCRIADTIEDDAGLDLTAKHHYSAWFLAAVLGQREAEGFAAELAPRLAAHATPAERELITHTPRVIRVTRDLAPDQIAALARCVRVMSDGMVHYQGQETLDGLPDQRAMDRYCYYVAGVVGEMLTELFCHHCPELQPEREHLLKLGISFGQGLQMTNILKDIWEDRARGACWLPRPAFESRGLRLSTLAPGEGGDAFAGGLRSLVGIAHGHLRNALEYTLMIPPRERGIRKFCLWALGMAVLTLRRIEAQPHFRSGQDVKISRRSVKLTIASTTLAAGSDTALRALFTLASTGLPQDRVLPTGPTYIEGMETRHGT